VNDGESCDLRAFQICGDMEWTELARDRIYWHAFVVSVMNLRHS
jgi:hypothetical protein